MARAFLTGGVSCTETFEGNHLYRFGNQIGANGAVLVVPTASAPSPMDGDRCLKCFAFDTRLSLNLATPMNEFYIGSFWITDNVNEVFFGSGTVGNRRIIIFQNGGTQLGYVRQNPISQKLDLVVGDYTSETTVASSTQAQVITAGTLYHVQIHVLANGASSVVQVKLDDTLVIDWPGTLGASIMDTFLICGPARQGNDGSVGSHHYFDNIIINDTTTAADNSWPGVLRYKVQLVAGPGFYSQFTPDPAVPNFQNVDDLPHDGDTTTNYA